jgi:putative hydrolase of HD superfamily
MVSVRKSLLQLVFAGSFMKRWNDKHSSRQLVVDKQAHKMMVAWMLFTLNSGGSTRQAPGPAERSSRRIFDYFYRLVITDIKTPVFYRMKTNPAHYEKLTPGSSSSSNRGCAPWANPSGTAARLPVRSRGRHPGRRILSAAHLYATVGNTTSSRPRILDEELLDIESSFRNGLSAFRDLAGVPDLADGMFAGKRSAIGRFARLLGQLRFPDPLVPDPRIPRLGAGAHVHRGLLCLLFQSGRGCLPARRHNNFFAGLFHDLPELLTRDIISPVKQSVRHIGDMIKEYEASELQGRVFAPLREGGCAVLADRLAYFLGMEVGSEFRESAVVNGAVRRLDSGSIEAYNRDECDPKDGHLLKVCDSLAAFIEAYTAMRNGITSDQLQRAIYRIRADYAGAVVAGKVHVGALLADLRLTGGGTSGGIPGGGRAKGFPRPGPAPAASGEPPRRGDQTGTSRARRGTCREATCSESGRST